MKNSFFSRDEDVKHIGGISCNVKNCVYHDGESYCTADKINVGPSFASSCTDTVCATFKNQVRS